MSALNARRWRVRGQILLRRVLLRVSRARVGGASASTAQPYVAPAACVGVLGAFSGSPRGAVAASGGEGVYRVRSRTLAARRRVCFSAAATWLRGLIPRRPTWVSSYCRCRTG